MFNLDQILTTLKTDKGAQRTAMTGAAGLAAVVTINRDTLEQDFTEASLVVSSLGEPGAPTRVLQGRLEGLPWVTVDTLRGVLAERYQTVAAKRAAA